MDVLERIKKQVGLVEELAGELEAEGSYRGLERLIQLTIQALLDLGLMVIAALGHGRPRAYSEIGYLLRELGVLGERARILISTLLVAASSQPPSVAVGALRGHGVYSLRSLAPSSVLCVVLPSPPSQHASLLPSMYTLSSTAKARAPQ